MAKLNAYQSGVRDGYNNVDVAANPYHEWTSDGKAWLVGWRESTTFQANIDANYGRNHWLRAE